MDVAVAGGDNNRSEHVARIKTGIGALKSDEAAGQRTADNHQHDGHSDLGEQ
jgi:hypothetical protein